MLLHEMYTLFSNINNIESKLGEASAPALVVELQMRLIGELSQKVKDQLKELTKKERPHERNYWNCKLSKLEIAIDLEHGKTLDDNERKTISEFRELRNKLIHGNFVKLLELLKILPEGRLINQRGIRNILGEGEIRESILIIDRNNGIPEFKKIANEVKDIYKKIIISLANNTSAYKVT